MSEVREMKGLKAKMQYLANEYRNLDNPWPATSQMIVRWALNNGRLSGAHEDDLLAFLSHQMSRALREEYKRDQQGRRVRAKHSVIVTIEGEQQGLWGDAAAGRDFMVLAFRQRRQQIVGKCFQLKKDVDSYNENDNPGEPVQLELGFEEDMAEREAMEKDGDDDYPIH